MPRFTTGNSAARWIIPYDAAFPHRQFAFVFNINRCIACQSCTMACKSTWTFSKGQEHMWWDNVETKPYGGYPQSGTSRFSNCSRRPTPAARTGTGKPPNDTKKPYGKFDGKTIFEAAKHV